MHTKKVPITSIILQSLSSVIEDHSEIKVIAIYAYGSVVGSDFDSLLSDLDVLVVIDRNIEPGVLPILESIHSVFSLANPGWRDRLDIAYMSKDSAKEIKDRSYLCAAKYDEALFSIEESKPHWLIDWYKVQTQGIVLFGEPPVSIFPVISPDELRESIRQYLLGWPANMKAKTKQTDLAFVVLTVCRSLYAFIHAENVSKARGAQWMIEKQPRFTDVIQKALILSRSAQNVNTDDIDMQRETTELVDFVCSRFCVTS